MNEEDSPAGTATAEIDVVDIADEEEGGSDQHSNPKVNMAHGFVRSIQRNQVTRGLCDQDEDAMRMAIRVGRSVKASTTRTSAASPTGAATAKARRREQQLYTPKVKGAAARNADGVLPSASDTATSNVADSPIMFVMDVEIAPGDWKEVIVRQSDTAQVLAKQVALDHNVEPRLAAALAYHIAISINEIGQTA